MATSKLADLTEAQIDLIQKTSPGFTKYQILDWFAEFKAFSKTNDYLNLSQFTQFYKNIMKNKDGNSDEFCTYIFKAFDTDNSGYIEFNEFMTALAINSVGKLQDKLSWIFAAYDIDNNGYIELEELKKILRSMYNMLNLKPDGENSTSFKFQVTSIWDQLDNNKDNRISKKEFIDGCLKDEFLTHFLTTTGIA